MIRPNPFLTVLLMSMVSLGPLAASVGETDAVHTGPTKDISFDPVFDEVLEIPPGGETRILLDENGDITTEGHIGSILDEDTKLKEAAEHLPDWLRDDFIRNMLDTAERPITQGEQKNPVIPAFGDLDADGDDDLVIGMNGELRFFKNIGTQGDPVFSTDIWDNWWNKISCSGDFVSPSLFDINSDGYADIIWGDGSEYLNIILNRGIGNGRVIDYTINGISYTTSSDPPTHISPAPITGENNTFKLYFGCRQGQVYYWEFRWEEIGQTFSTTFHRPPSVMPGLGVANFSSPRLWRSSGANEEYHNVVGMSVGSGGGLIKYHRFVDGKFMNPEPGYFRNVITTGQVTPVPCHLNGDLNQDLALGSRGPSIRTFVNYGVQLDPYWAPDPHIPAFEVENYGSAFDLSLLIYSEERIEEYLDLIISPPDPRYRDEIGFTCAFTPSSQLADNMLSGLLLENVQYIYGRDPKLEYVKLVEKGGASPYTTASYIVKVGDRTRSMEISRDAYYWGIVHPRITEETVAYIDPKTGEPAEPGNGGRYWREYLFEHADEEYPPGPDFPDDWTGRKVYYPRNASPPLLKAKLEDVGIYWDMQPYEYPKGFDNNGEKNSHPWDYRDHAIEKISHWVEKTLVLNQQESLDEERPNQPVRIAHGHNGNCGELQDLTIAAARCALVPARGVHLTGEDHVWSEFYLGGWHQWDNYWSDGGGVVANDLNYWWGWGKRGGSGVWASNGAGQSFDIGERYRSPDVTGDLTVNVLDASGRPVEGARVVVMSHWTMENAIDTGDFQGPVPTIPLPSIWGYTDRTGAARFTVWGQSFNFRVTSDLGTHISDKFTMSDEDRMTFHIRLQSDGPDPTEVPTNFPLAQNGRNHLLSVEVLESFQHQRELTTGTSFRNEMKSGEVLVSIYPRGGDVSIEGFYSSMVNEEAPLTKAFMDGGGNITVALTDPGSIKSHTSIRVKIYEYNGAHVEPSVLAVNPMGPRDRGFQVMGDGTLKGFLFWDDPSLDPKRAKISIGTSMGTVDGTLINGTEALPYVHSWEVTGIRGEPGTVEPMSFNVLDDHDNIMATLPLSVKISDDQAPRWHEIIGNGTVPWGARSEIGARFLDATGNLTALSWVDHEVPSKGTSVATGGIEHEILFDLDTSRSDPGGHNIRMTTWDGQENIQTLVCTMFLDPVAPTLSLDSPSPGDELDGSEIRIRGKVLDDVEIFSFEVMIDGSTHDMGDYLDEDGKIDEVLVFKAEPGDLRIELNATDNVGLWNSSSFNVTLLPPPDHEAPVLRFDDPRNGQMFEKGEVINFRGTVLDDSPLSSLTLTVGGYRVEILDDLVGSAFSHQMSTDRWSTGTKEAVLRAVDAQGNPASISMEIGIYEEEMGFRDVERPEISLARPEQGSGFRLGSMITIIGTVTDDGDDIHLYYSIDRGSSYNEIAGTVNMGLDFNFQVDTMDILATYHGSPGELRRSMSDQVIVLKAVDGVGRERYLELGLEIEDANRPTILEPVAEYSISDDHLFLSAVLKDDSMIEHVNLEIFDEHGDRVRQESVNWMDLRSRGNDVEIGLVLYGPFGTGEFTVTFTTVDAWGNSQTAESSFMVPAEGPDDESELSLGRAVFIFFLVFVLLGPLALYFLVVAFRRGRK
ncbi:MAG: transglutaminase domain-containing protein [Thermoplasmatota archaeon]